MDIVCLFWMSRLLLQQGKGFLLLNCPFIGLPRPFLLFLSHILFFMLHRQVQHIVVCFEAIRGETTCIDGSKLSRVRVGDRYPEEPATVHFRAR